MIGRDFYGRKNNAGVAPAKQKAGRQLVERQLLPKRPTNVFCEWMTF